MGKDLNVNLNSYVGKTITVKLNANRLVEGVLRGYDQMMNIILEDAFEVKSGDGKSGTFVFVWISDGIGYSWK